MQRARGAHAPWTVLLWGLASTAACAGSGAASTSNDLMPCDSAGDCASGDAGAVTSADGAIVDARSFDVSPSDAGAPSCSADAGCPTGLPAGIYVAPSGSDSAAGTPGAPLKTIAAAIALASQTKTFAVNICNDVYAENIVITSGLTLQGGFDCAHGWRATTDRVSIKPSKGTPITIDSAKDAVSLSRLYAKAPDAFETGASSIALFVANAAKVSLDHVELDAGYGGDGETAAAPPTVSGVAPSGADGQSLASFGCAAGSTSGNCGLVAGGGVSLTNDCHGTGGFGGQGGNAMRGTKPAGGGNGYPAGMGGAGGPVGAVITGTGAGRPGSDGASGGSGAAATTGFGSVSVTGYVASNVGANGAGGQSGGGGGGGAGGYSGRDGEFCQATYLGAGGGQGGFGGCGGQGGKGAGAGGASIAMLSVFSHVTMTNTTLDTASGGRGGDAAPGADGETGGAPGKGGTGSHGIALNCSNGTTSGDADQGGPGGRGGKGGPGGPGGGGPSIPLVATGYAPDTSAVVFNTGSGGKGGKAIVGSDGADGLAQHSLSLALATDGGAP